MVVSQLLAEGMVTWIICSDSFFAVKGYIFSKTEPMCLEINRIYDITKTSEDGVYNSFSFLLPSYLQSYILSKLEISEFDESGH